MIRLSEEEKELVESFERGEWKPVKNQSQAKKRYHQYAKYTFQKDKRINIRISEKDLTGIQKRAVEEGIPYQTLASSILHKYIKGKLVEAK